MSSSFLEYLGGFITGTCLADDGNFGILLMKSIEIFWEEIPSSRRIAGDADSALNLALQGGHCFINAGGLLDELPGEGYQGPSCIRKAERSTLSYE